MSRSAASSTACLLYTSDADDEAFKVHVHTDIPGEALTEAQKYGTLELAKIENMRTQAQQLAAGGKAQSTDDLEAIEQELEAAEHENAGEAEPEKDFGFLAVCAGEGLANALAPTASSAADKL